MPKGVQGQRGAERSTGTERCRKGYRDREVQKGVQGQRGTERGTGTESYRKLRKEYKDTEVRKKYKDIEVL